MGRKSKESLTVGPEERLRLLFESTAVAICGLDLEGKCTFTNPAGWRLLGYKASESVVGRELHALAHHSHADLAPFPKEECPIHQALSEGKELHVDSDVFWRADGRSFPVEYWSYPVRRDGELVGAVVTFLDISERERLNAQLRQALKMEAVGRLAGGIAHDFNNLLTVISGCCDLLLARLDAAGPCRAWVEEIGQAAKRAASLTHQLLAFSRRQMLRPEALDLNSVVTGLEDMLRRTIGEDISLAVALDPDIGRVKADRGQIEQVILNLVVNSRDAMPEGGKLTIETANVEFDETPHGPAKIIPGPYVMIAVSDTGCGMDQETQSHIFEPFFTTKGQDEGTGLGLSTVYGIVKQSLGYIWVYSAPGQGSTFKIYLPRVSPSREPLPAQSTARGVPQGSETILVVEDDDAVRSTIEKILQLSGYGVLAAKDSAQAVALCERNREPIQLLLTDVLMPEVGGEQLAEQVKALRPEIKLLFMSGYTEAAIARHNILGPGVAFLHKPFTRSSLTEKIREVLDS